MATEPDPLYTVPDDSPNWAFGPEQGVHCPDCNTLLNGINWVVSEGVVTAMEARPCGHQLPTDIWHLGPTGNRGTLELKRVTT